MNRSEEIVEVGKTPARAWAVLLVTYFASFVAPIVQMKVPALASWLFPAFQLDAATFGLLMSAISIIGVIMAFPVAFLVRKFGLKAMMVVALASLAIGSAIGAMSGSGDVGNTGMLMFGRLLEGVGLGCVGVVGPSCLSIWFPDKTRGLALGVWSTWIPMGSIITLNLFPTIAIDNGGNWQLLFWVCTALCIAALICFCIVFKMPEVGQSDTASFEGTVSDAFAVLRNKYIWILGIVFFVFNGILVGINSSYMNTFIETQLGFDAQTAASMSSISIGVPLIIAPLTGIVSDRLPLGKKKYLMTISMGIMFIGLFFGYYTGPNEITILWIFIGFSALLGGMCAGACRPMAPLVMQRSALGATMGMAVLQFCQNLGQSLYSPCFGAMIDATANWQLSFWVIAVPTAIIAVICSLFVTTKKSVKEIESQIEQVESSGVQ